MTRERAPPKSRRRTPADDPAILESYKKMHETYRSEGLREWTIYRMIAERHGTTTGTVYRWLNEDVRLRHNQSIKNQQRPDRKTSAYRSRSATRIYLYRHLSEYLSKVYSGVDTPLELYDLTLKIRDHLVSELKPDVLLKTKTLINLANQYDPPLLERVGDSHPPVYTLRSKQNV